jgi:hypothetical protein
MGMENCQNKPNRSRAQIIDLIIEALQKGAHSPADIRRIIKLSPKDIKVYLELIEYVQSKPKLEIIRDERSVMVRLDLNTTTKDEHNENMNMKKLHLPIR